LDHSYCQWRGLRPRGGGGSLPELKATRAFAEKYHELFATSRFTKAISIGNNLRKSSILATAMVFLVAGYALGFGLGGAATGYNIVVMIGIFCTSIYWLLG